MKKHALEFLRRGLTACGLGPVVLAVIYLIMQHHGLVQNLTVNQVCIGIFSLSALAFVAGGVNFIYRIEQFPFMVAVSIHGGILYICYLLTYLVNGWLEWGITPVLVFSVIFILGYLAIWSLIYSVIRRRTAAVNAILKKNQQNNQ